MATTIKLDNGGIMEFFKSEAVASYLGEIARATAASADSKVGAHVRGKMDNPNVVGYSKVLGRTAVGVVRTANAAAANAVAKHPDLIKSNVKTV